MAGAAGRGRLLRPEDRVPPEGRHRPYLAAGHHAGRLHDAGPPRRRVRGREQPEEAPGHAAPGHRRLDGALPGHPDRAPRRPVPGLAGADPGGGGQHHRRPG
ncbi:hypothetical protein G6F31_018463 [Rhizopus arrhizus]|nr:hypothetical protein G6F31_018463 [Rhizopus arrhizus]